MKLTSVRVENFKSILDSNEVAIQSDVTCIVGKNESGKSAFLNALYRLRPVNASAKFEVKKQYPAWLDKRHRREGKVLDEAEPIHAEFLLSESETKSIAFKYGQGTLKSTSIVVSKSYNASVLYSFEWRVAQISISNNRGCPRSRL
ncbi:AAA family ATPase [Acidicapsa acidisoli]|uniref:AAA family ATPase n=1 Tax=Acidicapsa acidisoli TaxID=1615681 RepID=UPI0037C05662